MRQHGKGGSAVILASMICLLITSTAFGASGGRLPDERKYELVTPVENNDADIHVPLAVGGAPLGEGIPTPLPFAVAKEGAAVTYPADPTAGGFGSGGNSLGNQYLAERLPSGGWRQMNIQPIARRFTYYRAFSSDLSIGLLTSGEEVEPRLPPLSPEAPGEGYNVLYECHDSEMACTISENAANPYRPLYGKPSNRLPIKTSSGWGTSENGHPVYIANVAAPRHEAIFAGASESFNTQLFEANDALPGVPEPLAGELQQAVRGEILTGAASDYLYSRSDGKLNLVDVLPAAEGGGVEGNATFGAQPFPELEAFDQPDFTRVISRDGTRIFWTDLNNGRVYARVNERETLPVSIGEARYWTASVDGRYVFYSERGQLYRRDLEAVGAGNERLALTDADAGVQGVIGVSEDGSALYFVAEKALAGENKYGEAPKEGEANLYVLYITGNERSPEFIATLSSADGHAIAPFSEAIFSEKGEYGDWLPGAGQRTAELDAGGDSVVFMSNQRLAVTGFPKGFPSNGAEEIYVYSASSRELYCISCRPTGESPPSQKSGAAAFLPISWSPTYLPQWISTDGSRVMFDSVVPLTPLDTNGTQDVYEWEKEGVGSCTSNTQINGGCLYLLSGGESASDSWLLGSSVSGDDVFVITRAELTSEDQNEAYDVYDVRVHGVELPQASVCSGTGCQGEPAPAPVFATPPSVTFGGVGNFTQHNTSKHPARKAQSKRNNKGRRRRALSTCRKSGSKRQKRGRCVRQNSMGRGVHPVSVRHRG